MWQRVGNTIIYGGRNVSMQFDFTNYQKWILKNVCLWGYLHYNASPASLPVRLVFAAKIHERFVLTLGAELINNGYTSLFHCPAVEDIFSLGSSEISLKCTLSVNDSERFLEEESIWLLNVSTSHIVKCLIGKPRIYYLIQRISRSVQTCYISTHTRLNPSRVLP